MRCLRLKSGALWLCCDCVCMCSAAPSGDDSSGVHMSDTCVNIKREGAIITYQPAASVMRVCTAGVITIIAPVALRERARGPQRR